MELFEEFLAVLDVSFDEGFELLEVVVEPAAQIVHKCTHTGYYGAHLPRCFVGFEAHSESGEFVAEAFDCSVEEYFSALLIALRALHFIAKQMTLHLSSVRCLLACDYVSGW